MFFILHILCLFRSQSPRLVIASAFDRENDIADIKISEAQNVADRIIFCESDKTQAGYPRPERLPLLKHKHSTIETYKTTCNSKDRDYKLGWKCENAPRFCAAKFACEGEPGNTIVVLSDLDEIIDHNALLRLKQTPFPSNAKFDLGARMAVFMYGFFWEFPGRKYSTASAYQCGNPSAPKIIRFPYFSGWHCSYCFPVDEYLSKMHSMLKGDGWLTLSDHYWSMEKLFAFRQHGLPLNGQDTMKRAITLPPKRASKYPYLLYNTNMSLPFPKHPFKFPKK